MLKRILLDGKPFDLSQLNYPILIHGEEGSGASLYTISLIANLFIIGSEMLVLCGYPMAQDEFEEQVEKNNNGNITFFVKEQVEDFKNAFRDSKNDTVILIKNIELFDNNLFELISSKEKIVISGNINKPAMKNELLGKQCNTEILFSSLQGVRIPELKKYEAYFKTSDISGITTLYKE